MFMCGYLILTHLWRGRTGDRDVKDCACVCGGGELATLAKSSGTWLR
uniref:Uncharacterized protein n=1 Tax=Anguilla anguilla TaxID=7936 RepID=A0A0E9UGH3_ANGAN